MAASVTKTVESGAFIRTTIRQGDRRKQETKRMTKNQKKVVLGYLGDFEVYVYPYDYPDSIFVGSFPCSTVLTSSSAPELLATYNKACWFLRGEWQNKPNRRKAPNARRRAIVSAYNHGLSEQRTAKHDGKPL